jgi:hypothetical protein
VLNYEKRLVVAYRFDIEGLVELNTKATTVFQVRPVAQTPVVTAPVALRDPIVVGRRHFLCFKEIKLVQLKICTTISKIDNYYSSRPVNYISVCRVFS